MPSNTIIYLQQALSTKDVISIFNIAYESENKTTAIVIPLFSPVMFGKRTAVMFNMFINLMKISVEKNFPAHVTFHFEDAENPPFHNLEIKNWSNITPPYFASNITEYLGHINAYLEQNPLPGILDSACVSRSNDYNIVQPNFVVDVTAKDAAQSMVELSMRFPHSSFTTLPSFMTRECVESILCQPLLTTEQALEQ